MIAIKLVMEGGKAIVILLLQQKNKKQGSTNLNPLRVFWNSRCAILNLISTTLNKIIIKKTHRLLENCYLEMSLGY